jgi:hypothetical protein
MRWRATADGGPVPPDGRSVDQTAAPRPSILKQAAPQGSSNLACPEGSEDDRRWFKRHPARSYRCRLAFPAEIALARGLPPAAQVIVATRQFVPGVRQRRILGWTGPLPPHFDSEAFARQSFEVRRP